MIIKYPFRLTLITLCMILVSWAIIIQIIDVISSQEHAQLDGFETEIIQAKRGNIYTANSQLLAVTSSKYNVRFDGVYAQSIVSALEIEALSSDLSKIFYNNKKQDYHKVLKKNNRYSLLKRNASFEDIKKIKGLQYYSNPLHGGLIIETVSSREKPNGNSAARTIGDLYENHTPKYGLEYSYNSELMGQDGKSLFLKKPGAGRIKIKDSNNIASIDGRDLITTIDLGLQDILEESLLKQLEMYKADFGTAILMEVRTGKIKAITNLKKTKKDTYAEILNFGVTRQIEPGSTMKLASIMAYFEDYDGKIEDTIDCKNGLYQFKGAPIETKDSKKLGLVSLKEAFVYSSNIGIGRLINKVYQNNPQKFIDRLYSFGLGRRSTIDLIGVPEPNIPSPSKKTWSGISLPWISFGYGVHLTPLDILTFYNAVANNGYFVNPYLGFAFREGSEIIPIEKNKISHTICSESTIQKTKLLLREVVQYGTAKKLADLPFSVSGKTGTTVKNYINYSTYNNKAYQSSFVGFFPSENPKYSCIVLIDNPDPSIGYYGSVVAVPAFKDIAHRIYLTKGLDWMSHVDKSTFSINSSFKSMKDSTLVQAKNINPILYPDVIGMHIRDALQLLDAYGHQVIIKGNVGIVKKQYPKSNTPVNKDLVITLFI